jgi:hypothetical protein
LVPCRCSIVEIRPHTLRALRRLVLVAIWSVPEAVIICPRYLNWSTFSIVWLLIRNSVSVPCSCCSCSSRRSFRVVPAMHFCELLWRLVLALLVNNRQRSQRGSAPSLVMVMAFYQVPCSSSRVRTSVYQYVEDS